MRALIAGLCALFLSLPAFAQTEGAMDARRVIVTNDVDFYGFDIQNIFGTSLQGCEAACLGDPDCLAFTFNSRTNACFPKSQAGAPQPYAGAISGRIVEIAPAILARAESRAGELGFLGAGDFADARADARRVARDHPAGANTLAELLAAADTARAQGDPRAARGYIGAALSLDDSTALWHEYARISLGLMSDNYETQQRFHRNALSAAINAYLRAEGAADRAGALRVMADALEIRGRGRDMIPALRLAQTLAPGADVDAALDRALARHGFRVIEHRVDNETAAPRICAEFSEPLAQGGVDYDSFIQTAATGLSADASGNQLCLDGVRHGESYSVTFRAGLPAASGETLPRPVTLDLYIRDRAPRVWFAGRAYILPAHGQAALPITSVNLEQADLRLSRVSDRNLIRSMQQDFFAEPLYFWQREEFDADMAELIWQGSGDLDMALNVDTTTSLPIGQILGDAPEPGVYVLQAAVPGADPYGDPVAAQWFIVSDLGLASMDGADGLHVFARSLRSAAPVGDAQVRLLSRANAVLGESVTDAQGYAHFPPGLMRGQGGAAPAMITLGRGDDMAFLSLIDPEFDLSDRGVEGRAPAGPVDVFLATDRGAYRGGEVIHATALARDDRVRAIDGLPLTAILTRPDGVEYLRHLSTGDLAGGHVFSLSIAENAPRGTWRLAVHSDPTAPPLAERAVLVEDFLPERIDVTLALPDGDLSGPVSVGVQADYLFGVPGADLPIEGELRLHVAEGLANWPGYHFGRHDQRPAPQTSALPGGQRTDGQGAARLTFDLPDLDAPGHPLAAEINIRVTEGAGRPVERSMTRALAPSGPMIGIRPGFDGTLPQSAEARFSIVALGRDGAPATTDLEWEISRVETRYQWYHLQGSWNWEPITTRIRVASGTIPAANAPVDIAAPVDWGRYELQVTGSQGAEFVTSLVEFTAGWYAVEGATDTPDMLEVALDAGQYAPGDTAHLRIDARTAGTALVAVMSNRLIHMEAVDLAQGDNTVPLQVSDDWGAGAYVVASLIRPLDGDLARAPVRALGLAHAAIDPGAHRLTARFDLPQTARPRGPLDVALQVSGIAADERAFVTIAAVDLGILNVTGHPPPDAPGHYFGKQRLGMALRDVYGRLIDANSGTPGALRSGGDAMAAMRMQSPPPTEDLVAFFTGPVEVGPDGMVRTRLDLPDFNGTLRLAAVVWSPSGVGGGVADVTVRDPVVVNATLPQFLAPGDQARMALNITHTSGPAGDIALDLRADAALKPGRLPPVVTLAEGASQVVTLPLTADQPGDHALAVELTTPDGQELVKSLRLPVRRNDPEVLRTSRMALAPGARFTLGADTFAGFVPGTARATLAAGSLARLDAPGLLAGLERAHYGGTEQAVSRALPLLYLGDLAQEMGLLTPADLADRIAQSIAAVLGNQASNGAFGLWSPGTGDLWLDAYATDFLSRARAQGYAVPETGFRAAMDNLRNQINYAQDFDSGGAGIAYALHVLARESAAQMGDLRYYADVKGDAFDSPLAAAQLGAALAAYGDPTRADAMFARAARMIAAHESTAEPRGWRDDYGTRLRDSAGVLALAVEAGSNAVDAADLVGQVAMGIADGAARSTQERVWALMAAQALRADDAQLGITVDGLPAGGVPAQVMDDLRATAGPPLVITNTSDQDIPLALTLFGVPDVPEPAGGTNYTIERHYFTPEGDPITPENIAAGARMVAVLTIDPWEARRARLLIEDPLPAGFEIDNPNLLRAGDISALGWLELAQNVSHAEFRADRFIAALEWGDERPFRLAYILRAVTPGEFHHPAASVQDLYRPENRAWTDAGRVSIGP